MTTPRLGVWIDDPIEKIDAAYASKLRGLGFTEAALMTNAQGSKSFELRAKPATFSKAAKSLRDAGVEVVVTCWPRPNAQQLQALELGMLSILDATNADAIEVDAEGNWLPDKRDRAKWSEQLVRTLTSLALYGRGAATRRKIDLTTYPFHYESGPDALVAPLVDRVFPQAYSVHDRSGTQIRFSDPLYGPGGMQRAAFERAIRSKAKSVCMGLAAYEQRFHGATPDESMKVALETAAGLGVPHVRYWSSKWILGALAERQPWADDFFRRISP